MVTGVTVVICVTRLPKPSRNVIHSITGQWSLVREPGESCELPRGQEQVSRTFTPSCVPRTEGSLKALKRSHQLGQTAQFLSGTASTLAQRTDFVLSSGFVCVCILVQLITLY